MIEPNDRRKANRTARILARATYALRRRRERKAYRTALARMVARYPVRSSDR